MNAVRPLIKRTKDRTLWRVGRGRLEPLDGFTLGQLRAKGYKLGDILSAELTKPRSPGFHRLAHQLGSMLAENIEAFAGMDSHGVLKRLQIEANVGCDEIALNFPGVGPCTYRVPRSLSFASMDEGQFREVIAGMCRHVSRQYWPTCSPDDIERMASVWVEAT
ncbi:hypothetical protein ACFFGH_06435 [Lysobacter korlensis]|uniref:Uncharacterized protein n=1 Tax=Lysobacter korlensis TaxID=553636 RepID=A0ABV6RKJ9_9GAMM